MSARYFYYKRIPLLGICYGMQAMGYYLSDPLIVGNMVTYEACLFVVQSP